MIYPGTYIETIELQNNEVLDLNSGNLQNGLIKISKLILKLASSVSDKGADSLLKSVAKNRACLPNFHNRFKSEKDIRSFTVENGLAII